MGTYEIVVTATDECGELAADTAYVEVLTDQGINLVCPKTRPSSSASRPRSASRSKVFLRARKSASTASPRAGTRKPESICFYSDCCLENKLTVTVTTACGSYSCSFWVYVQTNTPPLVLLPPDTTIVQCALEPVCVPLGVSDIDGNLAGVEVDFGTYDDYRNEVCFVPDTSGTYRIGVVATDSCGGQRTDELFVTVQVNQPPTISYTPIDTTIRQCEPKRFVSRSRLPTLTIISLMSRSTAVSTTLPRARSVSSRMRSARSAQP